MKRIVAALLLSLFIVSPSWAISRWGKINNHFSYDSLEIEKHKHGGLVLKGIIKNTTNETKKGVYIKIYAFNIFNEPLWNEIIKVEIITGGGEYEFSEWVQDGKEKDPYKLEFEVTE